MVNEGKDVCMVLKHPRFLKIGLPALLFLLLVGATLAFQLTAHAAGKDFVALQYDTAGDGYPAGQCTFYADARYHALHGIYVPWAPYYNAQDWTTAAYQYGWHVSSTPQVGDIIDLQAWVQWAGPLGHVGIVEQVLPSGNVIVSNLNWGLTYYEASHVRLIRFSPGQGVTFLRQP